MYSSLFSAGLVQLWQEKQLPSPTLPSSSMEEQQQRQLRSFLSFDDSTTYASTSRRSDRLGASTSSRRTNDSAQFGSPSSSRRSMDSVVTLPTRSGARSRSGPRRSSSNANRRHTVFSTTTATTSSSIYRPYSTCWEPSPLSNSTNVNPVGRRRSLPSAKPAPSASLPAAPHSSAASSSYSFYSSQSQAMSMSNSTPIAKTKTKKTSRRVDHHVSFVPSESSSGSSTSTISCLPTSSNNRASGMPSRTRMSKASGSSSSLPIFPTPTSTSSSSTPQHHQHSSSESIRRGRRGESSSSEDDERSNSPWTLPQIQIPSFGTSVFDFELFPRSFTPSLAGSETVSSSHNATSTSTSGSATLVVPSPSSLTLNTRILQTTITANNDEDSPVIHTLNDATSPTISIGSSSDSIHSFQSGQSMGSMLESTSSTSTVTVDDLGDADSFLDMLSMTDDALRLGRRASSASTVGDEMMGLEDGLESFRMSFDMDDVDAMRLFGASPFEGTRRGGEDDEEDDALFPSSVRASVDDGGMIPTKSKHTTPTPSNPTPLDRSVSRKASTIASVSTGYKRTKRSDALAQLEGRAFVPEFQFPPPHLPKNKMIKVHQPTARSQRSSSHNHLASSSSSPNLLLAPSSNKGRGGLAAPPISIASQSSFGCVGMAWGQGGFQSFMDSDEEDDSPLSPTKTPISNSKAKKSSTSLPLFSHSNSSLTLTPMMEEREERPSIDSQRSMDKLDRMFGTRDHRGGLGHSQQPSSDLSGGVVVGKEKMSRIEKMRARKPAEFTTTANPKRHGGANFIDLR